MKPKKRLERLKARQKDYEDTMDKLRQTNDKKAKGFNRPGSLNK